MSDPGTVDRSDIGTHPGTGRDGYDVVVVGARCAGAATARLLAAAGLHVLLVDRTRLPADTVSTHAIMLGGIVQLRRWGLLDRVAATGATPVDAVDLTVGDVSFTAPVKPIGGVEHLYGPRRITLDALLADAAVAAGAELRTGVTVRDVLRASDGRVVGVTGTEGSAAFSARARWVIGADGARSVTARLVGARAYRHAEATNACHYAYFTGLPTHHYEFAFAPGAGAGAIPTDGGLTCVYACYPAERVRAVRADLDAAFRNVVASAAPTLGERVADATRVTGYRGFRGLPGYLRRPWGPGWALVGDAGYHRDPFSAHGITDAFRDAELVAHAVLAVVNGSAHETADAATDAATDSATDEAADEAADEAPDEATDEAAAMDGYHRTRDRFARPFFAATTRLASYDWDAETALAELDVMAEVAAREARFLAQLPDCWDPSHRIAA